MADVCSTPLADSTLEKYAEEEAKILDIDNSNKRFWAGSKWIEEVANDPDLKPRIHSSEDIWSLLGQIDHRAQEIQACRKDEC